jgi:hypothetical protein
MIDAGEGESDADASVEYLSLVKPEQHEAPDTWWQRYERSLQGSLTDTARTVVELDSRYIVERCIMCDAADSDTSGVSRGVVMGAVQSGKTASMLGVTALCVDAGVDVAVILAGTRVALWRQTMDRLRSQLDGPALEGMPSRALRRLLVPAEAASESYEGIPPAALYGLNGAQVRRALRERRPIIAVVMKNVHHLRALADVMHERVLPAVDKVGRPVRLVVLDDEADDGSILDARIEQSLDPAVRDLKQIPRAIVDLWENRPHTGSPASRLLKVTYVGYTATPQANFLQSDHNPLAPTDFAVALRTPFDSGSVRGRRSTTYQEPRGLHAYYTGGEVYYRKLSATAEICTPTSGDDAVDTAAAVRAFLVAGAIRLWRDGRSFSAVLSGDRFGSRIEAAAASPRPHSMLLHPSAAVTDHFLWAAAVLESLGLSTEESLARVEAGERALPMEAVLRDLERDEPAWSVWLERYAASSREAADAFDLGNPARTPQPGGWPTIKGLLIDEVVGHTNLAVINSDERADERPQFEPQQDDDGLWLPARDLSTIFVSGNVMSRGLTLEGLTTTLFVRTAADPLADTQMQMQRWFGYRGRYIDLCRVFLPVSQLRLFRAYHDADEALRRDVISLMNEDSEAPPSPKVLQSRSFAATGKLANIANVPLCPGAHPFVSLLNSGREPDPNAALLADSFRSTSSTDVVVSGVLRGRILDEPLDLLGAAELLDGLRYERYRPDPDGWEASRWRALEAHVGLASGEDRDGTVPFFRPPAGSRSSPDDYAPASCPYALAAYLRLWKACLTRHARGLVATDSPQQMPWSMIDLAEKQRQQPRFYVGIRYGQGSDVVDGPLGELPFRVRAMQRAVNEHGLTGTWGSRNPGAGDAPYFGDSLFDYHVHKTPRPESTSGWRAAGAPGLLLFHVIEREGAHATVAVGAAVPLGGPDQFAARPSL